jgi:hypothetical protein
MHDEVRRLLDQYPDPPAEELDPGQVQAHLHARGVRVARDMDLGQVPADDLVALGKLDVLGQLPALDHDLALSLETIAAARDVNPHASFRQYRDAHLGHPHPINVTCTMPTDGAQALEAPTSDDPDIGRSSAIDRGQVDHHRAEVRKTRRYNPLKDHPDEEWS